jgi:hypothetical protein
MVEPPTVCASAGNPIRIYKQASRQMASRPNASMVIHRLVCLCSAMLAGSLSILPPELNSRELRRAAVLQNGCTSAAMTPSLVTLIML